MAQFKFSLESVLRHREHTEQQKQRDLAQFQSQMQQQKDAMDQLNQSMQAGLTDLRDNRLIGPLDVSFLAGHRRYMIAVNRQATALAQKMTQIQRQIDEAQQALAEAAKQRKIIEKLRERQKARWQADQSHRELAELDDVVTRMSAAAAVGSDHYRTDTESADKDEESRL